MLCCPVLQNFFALHVVDYNKITAVAFGFSLLQTSDFPVLDPNWTAQEEMALLEAVMDCGFGNWWESNGSAQRSAQWLAFPFTALRLTVEYLSAHRMLSYFLWVRRI